MVFESLADESLIGVSPDSFVWLDPDKLCFNRTELALGHSILRRLARPIKSDRIRRY